MGKARTAFRLSGETGREPASGAGGWEHSVALRAPSVTRLCPYGMGTGCMLAFFFGPVLQFCVPVSPCGLKPVGTESFDVVYVERQSLEITWEPWVGERKRVSE